MFFGKCDEARGLDGTELIVLPADQRLDAN